MKRIFFIQLVLLVVFLFPGNVVARPTPDSFADIVEDLLPTVVNISTSQTVERGDMYGGLPDVPFPPGHPFENFNDLFDQFQFPEEQMRKEKLTSLGSGFIVDSDGLIVTNYHVIANAEEITVTLHDESQHEAEIVGYDSKTDLAVLRLDLQDKSIEFPSARFGDSDERRVGDWVIAIGNPFNLGGTVTAGIISARARDINAGPFDDFIQTDAAINRGNSGGPMFDLEGRVIGINTAIFSPSGGNVGIGFAVPSNMAKPIIEQLKQGKKIKRGWLGVKIQMVTEDIAESMGLENEGGALVVEVIENSPAAEAGFKSGDIILEFDNKDIVTMRKLPRIVAETEVGKKAKVIVIRNGERESLTVELGELKEEKKDRPMLATRKEEKDKESAEELLGMDLIPLDKQTRIRYEIDGDVKGLLVVAVNPSSDASLKGIRPGDIVLKINQKQVVNLRDAKRFIGFAKEKGRKSVLVYISRDGETLFIALPVEED